MTRATAPGRGGIIGNPSDMYGGTVVSRSIAERAEATVSSSPRLIFDIYGQWAEISSDADLEFDPELHFLDVGKAVWRYLPAIPRTASRTAWTPRPPSMCARRAPCP